MDEVIVVEDRVDAQCIRHVHLMSNSNLSISLVPFPLQMGKPTREAGVWHYRAQYPYRGALDVACINNGGNVRRLVVWNLNGYGLIQMALKDAWDEYLRVFGGEPEFAFIKKLPERIENGREVGGMTLIETEWMLDQAVAVGCKE